MAKETEKRLIRTLEFLKEPQGSTIPTIVRAMNDEGPQVSLKKVVLTLKGCLDNGLLKVADGRVKLRQANANSGSKSRVEKYLLDPKNGSGKTIGGGGKSAAKCTVRRNGIPKSPKICKPVSVVGANSEDPKLPDRSASGGSEGVNRNDNTGGGGGGSGGGEESIADRPRASQCKPKRPRPKPRTAQKCPKARARRRRPKPKCCPQKRRVRRRRRRCQKKNPCKKKPKIQPYCKKPKSRPSSKC